MKRKAMAALLALVALLSWADTTIASEAQLPSKSALPWMMRSSSFDILVIHVLSAASERPVGDVVESIRGKTKRGSVELSLASLSATEQARVKAGGRFLVFAVGEGRSATGDVMVSLAIPADPELVARVKSVVSRARQVESISAVLLIIISILPVLCVGLQVKLRRSKSAGDNGAARASSRSGFALSFIYMGAVVIYFSLAPRDLPGVRIDLMASVLFCAYCLFASHEFLSSWAKGGSR